MHNLDFQLLATLINGQIDIIRLFSNKTSYLESCGIRYQLKIIFMESNY